MIRMIREKLAVVLWLVIAAFIATIVFEWGMGGFTGPEDIRVKGYIARINGEDVRYAELKNIEDNHIRNLDEKDASGVQVAEARQRAWNDLVKMVVIRQELEKQNIVISREQLYHEILNNPLPELRNTPELMTNGVFDHAKYEDFIKNPRPEFEQFYRAIEQAYEGRIPGSLLEARVANAVYISDFDLLGKYMEMNVKAKVKYLRAEVSKFMPEESDITDREIEDYFKNNPHEFPKMPEQRSFDYVLFSTFPTARDSARVTEDINFALRRLNDGVPFEEVARNYSDDATGQNGGDLGFFERGAMVPEFEQAAFSAPVGEVVGPVKTEYGYHIIKVTDQKKELGEIKEIRASHILVQYKAYQDTYEDAQYSAVNLRDEIYRIGADSEAFTKAAASLGFKINESAYTAKTDRLNEFGTVPGLGDFLFKSEAGTVSSIMVSNAGYLILRVKDVRPERERTLDEVKRTVIFKIRQKKALQAGLETLTELRASVTDTLSMNQAAMGHEGLSTAVTAKLGPDTFIDNIGVERLFYEIASSMEPGQISAPFKGTHGAYIIRLLERDRFDQRKYEEEKASFRERQESFLRRDMVKEWLDKLVEKAEVVDYRGMYR